MKITPAEHQHLAALIQRGATITHTAGFDPVGVIPLADAILTPSGLGWVRLWPDNEFDAHLTPAERVEIDGPYLNLYRGHDLAAGVAPLEGEEPDQFRWREWADPLREGRDGDLAFCAEMIQWLRQL